MIFSIGHSNHDIERFVRLLKQHNISLVIDVRSAPYSRYSPQFNQAELRRALETARIGYRFCGEELGGRPRDNRFYDDEGHVLYDRLAESSQFRRGLEEVERLGRTGHVALMCSEENPAVCHRFLLISRVLETAAEPVLHIRGNGGLQTQADTVKQAKRSRHDDAQLSLFDAEPDLPWRSLQSVSQKRPQQNSSELCETPAYED